MKQKNRFRFPPPTTLLLFLCLWMCFSQNAWSRTSEGAATPPDPVRHFFETHSAPGRFETATLRHLPLVSGGEDAAVQAALNQFVPGVVVTGLQVTPGAGGKKNVSGNISLFGSDAVGLEGELNASSRVEALTITFPASVSINLDQLNRFFGGSSLADRLPAGFPTSTGLSIQNLGLKFAANGTTLTHLEAGIAIGAYSIPGFSAFSMEQLSLSIQADNPTAASRSVGGTLAGSSKIGAIPVQFSAALSTNPEDIVFSGTAKDLTIGSVLQSLVGSNEAGPMLALIPEVFKSLSMTTLTASLSPGARSFSGIGESSLGAVEIKVNGASGGKPATMQLGVAPPASFKFSQIDGALSPLDGIGLSGTALVISSQTAGELSSALPGLEQEQGALGKGINLFTDIKFGADLAGFLKVEQLRLRGAINDKFNVVNIMAGLGLDLSFSSEVTMKNVEFGVRISPAVPIEFGISGQLDATINQDRLRFQAGFNFSPTDQQISGEFFMQALKKGNGAEVAASSPESPPEWSEPFGIPGFGIRRLGASVGIDFKLPPVFLSKLGFTGAARLGTVADKNKHIEGAVTTVINVGNPSRSMLDVSMENMTVLKMIKAFQDDPQIKGILEDMLNTGFDSAKARVVPVDGLVAFGKTYEKGISFGAAISVAGLAGFMDFTLSDSGIKGDGALESVNLGNGFFQVSGTGGAGSKPLIHFALEPTRAPEVRIDGKVSIFGISREVSVFVDANGFEFITAGKLLDLFEMVCEVKGTSFANGNNPGLRIRAALRNDLVATLNKEIMAGLDAASKSTRDALMAQRKKLEDARAIYREVEERMTKRRAEIRSRREADLKKMRDEALRAKTEAESTLNWHREKINNIQTDLNNLDGDNPLDWPEIGALEVAKGFHQAAIETEKVAVEGYAATVNGLADIGEDFPEEVEMGDLFAEYSAKYTAVESAIVAVDVVDGVSGFALDAAKFMVDQAVGGIFDIRSAEFEGAFGLKEQNKAMVTFNIIFLKEPYNFTAEIDFKDLPGSASKLAGDIFSGNILKRGFAPTFADKLTVPPSVALNAAPVTLDYSQKIIPQPVFTYYVTVETSAEEDAGSRDKFDVTIRGTEGMLERLPLSKEMAIEFQSNNSVTFPFQATKKIGDIKSVVIAPSGSLTDNLKIKGVGVQTSYDPKYQFADCPGCNFATATTSKTIAFDGKKYADYWLTISTSAAEFAGTDEDVTIELVGEKGRSTRILLNSLVKENAFEQNDLTEIPISIPDIGALTKVNMSVRPKLLGLPDAWGFGGIVIRKADGSIQANFCNCELSDTEKELQLHPVDFYTDYTIRVKTKDEGGAGTDADISLVIFGDNMVRTEEMLLQRVLLRPDGEPGSLFESGNTDAGRISIQDFNCLKQVLVNFDFRFSGDTWEPEFIEIVNSKQGFITSGPIQPFTNDEQRMISLVPKDVAPRIKCPSNVTVPNIANQCAAVVNYENPVGSPRCSALSVKQTSGLASGASFPVGQTVNTYRVSDSRGRSATCSFTVSVENTQGPTIECKRSTSLGAGSSIKEPGKCGGKVSQLPFTSSAKDVCGNSVPVVLSHQPGSFFPVGITKVTALATDLQGRVASCTFNVSVLDAESPGIKCPANKIVPIGAGQSTAIVNYATPAGTDNCSGHTTTQISGLASGAAFPMGVTKNEFEVKDKSGLSARCSFTVTVADQEAPEITCPAGILVDNIPGTCAARVDFAVSAKDNHTVNPGIQLSHKSGSSFPLGTTVVKASTADGAGNTANCQFSITVRDKDAPKITCPANLSATTDPGACTALIAYATPAGTDNCAAPLTVQISGLPAKAAFPIGVTNNIFRVTDKGNNSATCSFTVTVTDKQAPVIVCPANMERTTDPDKCTARVTYPVPAGIDNCEGANTAQNGGLNSGADYPIGVTTNTFLVTDKVGLTASCAFTVTVSDKQAPAIACPANMAVNSEPDKCTARVTYAAPVGADNCGTAATVQNGGLTSGVDYPIGVTTNTFLATDKAGLTASCAFTVTVSDKQAPAIACPANIVVNSEPDKCTARVTYAALVGADNCSAPVTGQGTGLTSGVDYPVGVTTNTFLVTDKAGLTASCAFTVTVIDKQAPTIACPADMAVTTDPDKCTARVTYPVPAGVDNCADPATAQSTGLGAGVDYPVGVTTNTFLVTDKAGLTASCVFTVTVSDKQKPDVRCPANLTQSCEISTAPETVGNPVTTDNCAVQHVQHTDARTDGSCPGNFILTRTWTVDDVHGNTNVCTQTITVVDQTPPVLRCPAAVTVTCDINPETGAGMGEAKDNCGQSPVLQHSDVVRDGACPWLCTIERTWLSTDRCGNTSTCLQVITKNTLPLIEEALGKDLDGDGQTDTLVLGHNNVSLTIPPGAGNCILAWMPGAGTQAKALEFEKFVVTTDCRPGKNPVDGATGRLNNPLLAEAIKLNLLVRLRPELGTTALSSLSCNMPGIVKQSMARNPDINELVRFTNLALGNNAPLLQGDGLNQLLGFLKCVNEPLDLCK